MIICSLFELDLTSVPTINQKVCLTDAAFDVEFNGETFRAFGSLLKMDKVSTKNTLDNKTMKITLSGLDMNTVKLVNSSFYKKQPITVYKAQIRDESNIVETASIHFAGITDTPEMVVDYQSQTVNLGLSCKSIFDMSQTPNLMRSNNATHQLYHQGDKFFEFSNNQTMEDELWIR
ncbi:hypothetical protein E4630_12215 [Aeromonas hydrophila]|uniref:hypothetical protein n=1 Tax=Aeromonas hydrophila TaxID=644 RepID=UPI00107EC314|nr:hypothetical protein [Aeromonas hydrophila]QBX71565.1 hypothetical protein E4625_12435 [Aeromonas hydrophila]QBX76265.1 hypothetical protein E4630_12215 [Aeromonas hydrophila]